MFQGAKENPSPRQMVVRTIIGLVVMFVIFLSYRLAGGWPNFNRLTKAFYKFGELGMLSLDQQKKQGGSHMAFAINHFIAAYALSDKACCPACPCC